MESDSNIPVKFLIEQLKTKDINAGVWIQGTIEQSVGTDILIISDGTGKAKISRCDLAEGTADKTWISKGAYCCVIGHIIRAKGLPEIVAKKIINLSDKTALKNAWRNEVRDLQSFMNGETEPEI